MEADSTTYDSSLKSTIGEQGLPFNACPSNFQLYNDLTSNDSGKSLESQIIERLQTFGLLPQTVRCPTDKPDCKVISKNARVIDRVQWVCEGCGKRQTIRTGSFFLRLQCSLLQALQMILAWCEDADCDVVAQNFGVKPRVASLIYDKMDELAVKEQNRHKLGGEDSVVLAELYPDCLTRLSPDTTDRPHLHRLLMLADTNHIPTHYQLHVIKDDLKKNSSSDNKSLKTEIEEVITRLTLPDSILVTGTNVPLIEGASTIQQLVQYCDVDMQHFLTTRIWRQAMTVCAASGELCAGAGPAAAACAGAVQRYLHAAMWRLRHGPGYYRHMLRILAEEYTDNDSCNL